MFSNQSTQEEVYEQIQPYVRFSFEGESTTILLHGPAGTGKSYTSIGNQQETGFIFRAANEKLAIKDQFIKEGWRYYIAISSEEVYADKRFDLFDFKKELPKSTQSRGMRRIQKIEEAQKYLKVLANVRRSAKIKWNNNSSRSHFIILFMIYGEKGLQKKRGQFIIVDLAGWKNPATKRPKTRKTKLHRLTQHIKHKQDEQISPFDDFALVRALHPYLEKGQLKVLFNTGSNNPDVYQSICSRFTNSQQLMMRKGISSK